MAKRRAVNKTKAVREYLGLHPGAMPIDVSAALAKQNISVNPRYVANIKSMMGKESPAKKTTSVKQASPAKKAAMHAAPPTATAAEKPANGHVITLEQIKKVAHAVQALGGLHKVAELLEVIKGSGGLKKFTDLAEAIASARDAAV